MIDQASNDLFFKLIAILAGGVLVSMLFLAFMILRFGPKEDTLTPADDEPLPPVENPAASPPEKRTEEPWPSPSPVAVAELPPEESPKYDRPSMTAMAIAAPPREEEQNRKVGSNPAIDPNTAQGKVSFRARLENLAGFLARAGARLELKPGEETRSAIPGILLTAALISALDLGLFLAFEKESTSPGFLDPLAVGLANRFLIGTALGGAVGLQVARLRWRQIVVAGLLAGVGLLLFSRFPAASTFPESPLELIYVPGGVFLLPLFDPALRAKGPRPAVWKLAPVVILLNVYVEWSVLYFSPFWIFIPFAVIFCLVLGLALSLSNERNAADGAWVGGLAVLISLSLQIVTFFRSAW